MGWRVNQIPSQIRRSDRVHEFGGIGAIRQDQLRRLTVGLLVTIKPVAAQSPTQQGDKRGVIGQTIDTLW